MCFDYCTVNLTVLKTTASVPPELTSVSKSCCPVMLVSGGLLLRGLGVVLLLSTAWQRNLHESHNMTSRTTEVTNLHVLCHKRIDNCKSQSHLYYWVKYACGHLCSMILAFGTSFQNWASSWEPTFSISAAIIKNLSCGDTWQPANTKYNKRLSFFYILNLTEYDQKHDISNAQFTSVKAQ